MRFRPRLRASLVAAGLLVPGLRAVAQEAEFAPGPVWIHRPAAPALPRSLAFAGPDHLWEACAGPAPALTLLATARGAATPLAVLDPSWLAGASGPVAVAAGDALFDTYALATIATAVPGVRRPRVLALDPAPPTPGTALQPRWLHELAPANGPAQLAVSADGTAVVVGVHDARVLETRVRRLDPRDGIPLWERTWRAGGLAGPLVASDGTRTLLATGLEVVLLDADGNALWTRAQGSSTSALALSADGTTWAHGEGADVWVWSAAELVTPQLVVHGRTGELPVSAVLGPRGESVAVTWWDTLDATGVHLEWRATADGQLLADLEQQGAPTDVQNFPASLAIAADGSRVALGLWGADDARPEVLVLVGGEAAPRLAEDLGASVETLALAPRSNRLAVARRADHANRLSLGGETRLFETEGRDVVLLATPRLGGSLDVALQASPGDTGAWLFAGVPLPAPQTLAIGSLALARRPAPSRLPLVRPTDTRFEAHLPVPPAAELLGLELALQAVRLGPPGPRLSADAPRLVLY